MISPDLAIRRLSTEQPFCRLCGEPNTLKRSHIVSAFVWRLSGLIGDKKKFDVLCTNRPELSLKHQQDGFKEYLLCESCEGRRALYESTARRSLFSNIRNLEYIHNNTILHGSDYKSLKLYSMYQIWMMGVSEHPFYSHVELGPHLDRLKNMLLNDEPGEPWQYATIISVLGGNNTEYSGIFAQPERFRLFGHNVYRYVVAGLYYYNYVTNHPPHSDFQLLFLQKNGTMPVFQGKIRSYPDLIRKIEQAQVVQNVSPVQ